MTPQDTKATEATQAQHLTLAHTPIITLARMDSLERARTLATARQHHRHLLQQVKTADDRGDTAQALQLVQQYRTERRAYNALITIFRK